MEEAAAELDVDTADEAASAVEVDAIEDAALKSVNVASCTNANPSCPPLAPHGQRQPTLRRVELKKAVDIGFDREEEKWTEDEGLETGYCGRKVAVWVPR